MNRKKTTSGATNHKTPSRTTIIRNADKAFSLFIRTRDSQAYECRAFRCISCSRVLPVSQADAGHYINRAHMSLRYSEDNVHAQCRHCNRFREGDTTGFRRGLIQKLGEQKVELLEAMKHATSKITTFELQLLAKHYKEKTRKFKYQIK